ncbi:MAG: zinc-binding dehydrogenase [Bacteroidota bacterium]
MYQYERIYLLDFVNIDAYWETMVDIIKPQGHIVSISDSQQDLNLGLLKAKSVTFSWEFMYTRSMYTTEDIDRQHDILNELSRLLDEGVLQTTLTTTLSGLSAATLKEAHTLQESGKSIGKTVITF